MVLEALTLIICFFGIVLITTSIFITEKETEESSSLKNRWKKYMGKLRYKETQSKQVQIKSTKHYNSILFHEEAYMYMDYNVTHDYTQEYFKFLMKDFVTIKRYGLGILAYDTKYFTFESERGIEYFKVDKIKYLTFYAQGLVIVFEDQQPILIILSAEMDKIISVLQQ